MKPLFVPVLAFALLVPVFAARADVPATISYQGVLTGPTGVAVGDGTYSIRFRLYLADGATVAWEETQNVAVASGRFSVALGSVVPFGALPFDQPYQLGIKVGGDPELAPLTALASVPYSLRARSLVMAPTQRYHSVCVEAFTPGSLSTSYNRNTVRLYSTTAGFAAFGAPLHLPHGARLTGWRVLFEDLDATREVALVLRRTNLTTGAFQQLAALTSGLANAAGLTLVAGSVFSDDIVDNQNWAYSLQASWGSSAGSNLALAGVGITYQITEPLP